MSTEETNRLKKYNRAELRKNAEKILRSWKNWKCERLSEKDDGTEENIAQLRIMSMDELFKAENMKIDDGLVHVLKDNMNDSEYITDVVKVSKCGMEYMGYKLNDSLEDLSNMSQEIMNPPVVHIYNNELTFENGRHRTLNMYRLGFDNIPVMFIN